MNASSTGAAPSLAETRLPSQGAHMDTKPVLSGASHRGPPGCVYYQHVLAAAERCTEGRACGLQVCSWM